MKLCITFNDSWKGCGLGIANADDPFVGNPGKSSSHSKPIGVGDSCKATGCRSCYGVLHSSESIVSPNDTGANKGSREGTWLIEAKSNHCSICELNRFLLRLVQRKIKFCGSNGFRFHTVSMRLRRTHDNKGCHSNQCENKTEGEDCRRTVLYFVHICTFLQIIDDGLIQLALAVALPSFLHRL